MSVAPDRTTNKLSGTQQEALIILDTRSDFADAFAADGFALIRNAISAKQAREIVASPWRKGIPARPYWSKAGWIENPLYAGIIRSEKLLRHLRDVLGEDIILWGVQYLEREPGHTHAWHLDVESKSPEGGFASVWIGLGNITGASTLNLIRGSHLTSDGIAEDLAERSLRRTDLTAETMLSLARNHDPSAALVVPQIGIGDAIVFDGRIWHGSSNRMAQGTRTALLLQYARADRPVRCYDLSDPDAPKLLAQRPPVGLVAGTARDGLNPVLPLPPVGEDWVPLMSPIWLNSRPDGKVFHPSHLFRMKTRNVDMSCHYSTLAPGHSPHRLHTHSDEEVLIVINGEATALIGRDAKDPNPREETLEEGQFVFYAAGQAHTIENRSEADVTYLMFRWSDDRSRFSPIRVRRRLQRAKRLPTRVFDPRSVMAEWSKPKFKANRLFHQPTGWTRYLHGHVSRVRSGGGYGAHRDAHDVAIVMFEGSVEIEGRTVSAPGVAWLPAGCLHGLRNPTNSRAVYLVFEFHNALA